MSNPGWIDPPWIQGVDASAKECVGDLTMTERGPTIMTREQEHDDCSAHKITSLPKVKR